MPIDPYSLCPCGSGKKVKFCCHDIVDEMQRIMSLRQNNQLHMALQSLGKLRMTLKSGHPGETWVRITELTILIEDNQLGAAKSVADEALEALPDDPQVIALTAMTTLMTEGREAAQGLIDRAVGESAAKYPYYVSNLTNMLSQTFRYTQKAMAARKYLFLALRMAEDPSSLIEELSAFDNSLSLPYWLRSDYRPRDTEVSEELQADYDHARDLVDRGCFLSAAAAFEALANKQPDNADLWYNTALCLAWLGDERGAIEAFGESARAEDDFDEAVGCETFCQMLEMLDPEDESKITRTKFRINSVSKLLTVLDGNDRILPVNLMGREMPAGQAGAYDVLDRPVLKSDDFTDLTIEKMPNIIAHLVVFDVDVESEEPAHAILECVGQQDSTSIISLFVEAAQGEVEQDGETQTVANIPLEIDEIQHNWHVSSEISTPQLQRLEEEYWQNCLNELWPNLPLAALDGKTPLEAVGDEELQVELAAALNTFEAICDQQDLLIDVGPLRERLGVSAPAPLVVDPEADLFDYSLPQFRRMILSDLSDEQILHVSRRANIVQMKSLTYDALIELLKRPKILENEDANAIYSKLVELCKRKFSRDEALEWIEKGREYDSIHNPSLEVMVAWDLREVAVRLWDSEDPKALAMLKRLWEETSVKLPILREILTQLVESSRIDPPWNDTGIQLAGASQAVSGEVWTPDAQPEGETSKLWVPGQD